MSNMKTGSALPLLLTAACLLPGALADDTYCVMSSVMGSGFSWDPEWCTMLWFDGWVLDTKGKVAVAAMGLFGLAMFYEWLAVFAIKHAQAGKEAAKGGAYQSLSTGARAQQMHHLQASVLYMVRVCLGQMLMLVTMTYASWLFVPMVLGWGVGHFVFRKPGDVVVEADPCCG